MTIILLEFIDLFLLYFFIEIKINWCCMIKYEIILLFIILVLWISITHNVDVGATMINMHNVIDDFHILWIISWVPLIILSSSALLLYHVVSILVFSFSGLCSILRSGSRISFICVVVCLISLHVDFVAELLWIFSYSLFCLNLIIALNIILTSNKSAASELQTVFNWGLPNHVHWIHTC